MCVFIHVTIAYICVQICIHVGDYDVCICIHMNVGKYVCSKGLLPKSLECLFLSKAM